MAEPLYVICGATGHVGGIIASRLLDGRKKVRVVARSANRLAALAARGAEPAAGSMEDPAFLAKALQGAAAAFVLIPPNLATKEFRAYQLRVVEAVGKALESARVARAMTLSSIGAHLAKGNGPIAALHALEERLDRISGLAVLHLRPGYFMENHLAGIGMVKGMGIYGSALSADLKIAQIASRDIGEAGARRMLALDWKGKGVLELQGPRDLSMAEATRAIGKAIGKPDLAYVQFSYPDARKGMVQAGLQEEMADLYVEMSRAFNDAIVKPTQPRSKETTAPTTIEAFAEQVYAPAFQAS
jgi:uncharacterized protein YbjT (DUF2867 family)